MTQYTVTFPETDEERIIWFINGLPYRPELRQSFDGSVLRVQLLLHPPVREAPRG